MSEFKNMLTGLFLIGLGLVVVAIKVGTSILAILALIKYVFGG